MLKIAAPTENTDGQDGIKISKPMLTAAWGVYERFDRDSDDPEALFRGVFCEMFSSLEQSAFPDSLNPLSARQSCYSNWLGRPH